MSGKIVRHLFIRPRWLRKTLGLVAVPLLLASSVAGADAPARAAPNEADKTKAERKKIFLLRSADEVNWSLSYAQETIDVLTEQAKAATGHEPEIKVDERAALLKWYHRYADWLGGIADDFHLHISDYYSGKRTASWVKQAQALEKGSGNMAGEMRGTVRRLEGERSRVGARLQKLRTAMAVRRLRVNTSNLELARELWPGAYGKSYRKRKAFYRDLTEENIRYLQDKMVLLEDRQKYYDVLIELGKYEQYWLLMKTRDFSRLAAIARAIARDDQAGTARAFRSAVRTYTADIAVLKKRVTGLEAKLDGMNKAGSLETYELLEELSRYYEMLKRRFERQIEWLTSQIGSYQADLVEMGRKPRRAARNQ